MRVEDVRREIARALGEDKAKYVVAYRNGGAGPYAVPAFITDAAEAETVVWDPTCFHNLARFIVFERRENVGQQKAGDEEEDGRKPIGLVVKGCDSRAVAVLLQEKFINREDVYLIGVSCEGAGVVDEGKLRRKLDGAEPTKVEFGGKNGILVTAGDKTTELPAHEVLADRCIECRADYPVVYDVVVGDNANREPAAPYGSLAGIESMSADERWAFWERELAKCIRCYACRSICPMCYCDECVVDTINFAVTAETTADEKALKIKWVERSPALAENVFYHLVRAIHLAGRCIDCNECERACPVGIPLRLLNKKLEKSARELFGYEAGCDPAATALISSFRDEDPEEFIR